MITFRHHAVSLVAVFLALAVGIALGGGPLADDERPPDQTRAAAPADDATRRTADFGNAFAGQAASAVYAGRLGGHPVAILAMPGADKETISALSAQIGVAGAEVSGVFQARPALVDPGQKSLVDTLGSQLMTQLGNPRVDPDASTYVRIGQLVALAVATKEQAPAEPDDLTLTVRKSLAGADLLTSAEDAQLAPLVLVVLPPGKDRRSADTETRAVLSGLVTGLGGNAAGVVAVGDTESAAKGELAAIRGAQVPGPVSTVDGTEAALGQVTAVLALIGILGGTGGSFGASGADGPVPIG